MGIMTLREFMGLAKPELSEWDNVPKGKTCKGLQRGIVRDWKGELRNERKKCIS